MKEKKNLSPEFFSFYNAEDIIDCPASSSSLSYRGWNEWLIKGS